MVDETAVAAPLLGEALPVELMNTVYADRDGVHDALADPDGALAWLRAVHSRLAPLPEPAGAWLNRTRPEALAEAAGGLRRVRDAARELAAELTADPGRGPGREAVEAAAGVLDAACAAGPTWSSLHWPATGGPRRIPRGDAPAGRVVVAAFAERTIRLLTGPDATGLRACRGPGCVLYFVKGHPRREWCSAGCGNRARVARHYRRHRGPSS